MSHEWQQGEYRISTDPASLQMDVVHGYLSTSYWATGITRDVLLRAIENSIPFGLYHNGRQVGFARAVTDFETFAWLADVYVAPAARGRGVATAMTRWLVGLPELGRLRKWVLATRDAQDVYRGVGFVEGAAGRFMVREER